MLLESFPRAVYAILIVPELAFMKDWDMSAVHLPLGFPLNTLKLGTVVLLEPVHTCLLCSPATRRRLPTGNACTPLPGGIFLAGSTRDLIEMPSRSTREVMPLAVALNKMVSGKLVSFIYLIAPQGIIC